MGQVVRGDAGRSSGPQPSSEVIEGIGVLTAHQRRIFDILATRSGGATVVELAALVSSHENTVRGHLEVLESRGLVRFATRVPSGPGRPSRVYHAAAPAPHVPGEYLASLVRSLVRSLAGDDGAARAFGRRWAEDLIAEGKFDSRTVTPLAEIEALFARMGCSPVPRPGGILELENCPFLEPGCELPPLLCALHQGAVETLVATLARNRPALGIAGVELQPFSGRGCSIRVSTKDPP